MGWQYFGLPNAPYPPPLTSEQLEKMCDKINTEIKHTSELASFYQVVYNDPYYTNGGNVNKHLSEILSENVIILDDKRIFSKITYGHGSCNENNIK